MTDQDIRHNYQTADLLLIRAQTHELYTENPIDLDVECTRALKPAGDEPLLDVGCGPGVFLRHLRGHGHTGRLAGLDQSNGMLATAREASAARNIEWLQGEADALPFADGEFTIVSARHMLYHVPDIPAALREFARVAGSGRTVFVSTNGPDNNPNIEALENDLVAHFDLPSPAPVAANFNTGNAPGVLGSVFAAVEETVLTNALVFTEPAPVVRYVMTSFPAQRAASTPGLLAQVNEWLTAQATERLARMGGVWRDPKSVGLYRCRVA